MKDISIDCRDFTMPSDLHQTLADALSFPDHYGNNLDALHDCLTDISEETRIRLLHWEDAEENLGKYGLRAKKAILHAASANPLVTVTFI